MLNRLQEANRDINSIEKTEDQNENVDSTPDVPTTTTNNKMNEILSSLEEELIQNKFGQLESHLRERSKSALARSMTEEDKEFVEMIDQQYYKRVKTSDEYYRRKKLILMNLEKL